MAGSASSGSDIRLRLAGQMSYAMLARLGPKVASTLLFIVLLRQFGAAAAGALALATAFLSSTVVLSSLGVDELIVREVARRPTDSRRYLVNGVAVRLFLAAVGLVVVGLVAIPLLHYDEFTQRVISIQLLALFPEAVTAVVFAILNANRELKWMAMVALLVSACQLVAVGLVMASSVGLETVVWLLVASSGLGALVGFWRAARICPNGVEARAESIVLSKTPVNLAFCRRILRRSLPFALVTGLVSLDAQVDVVALSILGSLTDVGTYSAARTIILTLSLIPQGFRIVMYPELVTAHAANRERLLDLYERAWKYVATAGWPLCTGLVVLAPGIVAVVYGSGHEEIAWPLALLAIHLLVGFLYVPGTRLLVVSNNQAWLALWSGIALAVNVSGCVLLVPAWHAVGAAAARAMASAAYLAAVELHVLRNVLPDHSGFRQSVVPMLSSAAMAALLMVFQGWSVWVLAPVGAATYGLLYLTLTRGLADVLNRLGSTRS